MKTEFDLEVGDGDKLFDHSIKASIIGKHPKDKPYLAIYGKTSIGATQVTGWIPDRQLERFAVNILKALKSKHLTSEYLNNNK